MAAVTAAAFSSALRGVSGGMQRNQQMLQQAEQYGVAVANTKFTLAMAGEAQATAQTAAMRNAGSQKMQVQMNAARAESETKVSAATSGTTGASVDMSLDQISTNSEWALDNVDKSLEDRMYQIQQSSISTRTQAVAGMPSMPDSSAGGSPLLRGGLQGLMTYGTLGGFS